MKRAFSVLKDRPQIPVVLTRDSVAAGDDCDAPHEKKIEIHSFADPEQLAREAASGYLPSVAGSGHVWTCLLNGTKIAEITTDGVRPLVEQVTFGESNRIFFQYKSSTH